MVSLWFQRNTQAENRNPSWGPGPSSKQADPLNNVYPGLPVSMQRPNDSDGLQPPEGLIKQSPCLRGGSFGTCLGEVCPQMSPKNFKEPKRTITLGGDSPFFSNIVLFKTSRFRWVSGGFLEKRIPGKNGEGIPRITFGTSSPEP